ncbi:MAG: sulfatase-like hydrolase/transferase [Polyangia bacterium]
MSATVGGRDDEGMTERATNERQKSWVPFAAETIVWLAAASLSWFVLLFAESLKHGVGSLLGGIVLSVSRSLQVSIVMSLPLVFLHLLSVFLYRRGYSWLILTTLAAAVIVSWPAFSLAEFLCSGDWISSRSWVWALQAGITVLTISAAAVAWVWHLLVHPGISRRLSRRTGLIGAIARNRFSAAIMSVAAIILVLGAHSISMSWIAAYQLLADAIAAATWLVAATVFFAVLMKLPVGKKILLVVSCVWIFLGGATASILAPSFSGDAVSSGRLSTATTRLGFAAPRSIVKFEMPALSDLDCSAVDVRRRIPLSRVPARSRRNVVLITVDALRRDVLGASIRGRSPTPNLTEFFSKTIECPRASTTYPATLFAMASAFTGRAPSDIVLSEAPPKSIVAEASTRVDDAIVLLPDNQWFALPAVDSLLLQGTRAERLPNAIEQTRRAVELLEEARSSNRSVFAWIHYYEPHQPYRFHENLEFGEGAVGAYLSEVAFVDIAFGRLARFLERNRWLEDTLVVVFADHGQALGERGYFGHHVYLTRPLTAIPFAFFYPNAVAGVMEQNVSIADIAPTVRHFLGLPVQIEGGGKSLFRSESFSTPRRVFAEAFPIRGKNLFDFADRFAPGMPGLSSKIEKIQNCNGSYAPKAAVIQGNYRLVVNRVNGAMELYDDIADPKSERNLASDSPAVVDDLAKKLLDWHRRTTERAACRLRNDNTGSQSVFAE